MKVRICPRCGKYNIETSWHCQNATCGETLSVKTINEVDCTAEDLKSHLGTLAAGQQKRQENPDKPSQSVGNWSSPVAYDTYNLDLDDETPIGVLRAIAWVTLVCGIILCIFLLSNTSDLSAELKLLFIGWGVGFAVGGLLGWAFLMVVCVIAENVIAARKALQKAGGIWNET